MASNNEATKGDAADKDENKLKVKAATAASKRKYCSTEYSAERRMEDLLDREEQHSANMANLREENNANLGSLVSMTRILSSRRSIDVMANTASAEAVINAMSKVTATIEDVGGEWDPETRQQVLLGAVGSRLEATSSYSTNKAITIKEVEVDVLVQDEQAISAAEN